MSEIAPHHHAAPRWLTDARDYDFDGFEVVEWPQLRAGPIATLRNTGLQRASLANPAQPWLDRLDATPRLAIHAVDLDGPGAAADLLGFVVEPASRRGIELLIQGPQRPENLAEADFVEPRFGYAYSLGRLRWALRAAPPPRAAPAGLAGSSFRPDPTQAAAIGAPDGVVQVIAPAGSGKTTVVVERVRELRRRGVPAPAIICLVFNRAARVDLQQRLAAAGLGGVDALTFHALAYRILSEAGRLEAGAKIAGPSAGQWRRLASIARAQATGGVWIEPADAAEILSRIKLSSLMSAERYAAAVQGSENPRAQTMAALYTAHDAMQREQGGVDFDELLLRGILLLRENQGVREHWQARYQQLLVDEYQDVEPAQELMTQILAAPHDQLFCVGDEDQTLYAFRRAGVERMIGLDGLYPGLQRVAFAANYRCPAKVVAASSSLISVNRVRFPKPIAAGRSDPGQVNLRPYADQAESVAEVAELIAAAGPDDLAVLSRTNNALRPLALACAERGIAVNGNDALFSPRGARLALQQHLRLALRPTQANAELVYRACQAPGRGLKRGAEHAAAARLRDGEPFAAAFAGLADQRHGPGAACPPGELFERLAACEDGAAALATMRGPGGLDQWFRGVDELAGLEGFESETLAAAEREAAGASAADYLADLERQAQALAAIRKKGAVELTTIHGAKGRQWPSVLLIDCEEGILPHARAGEATEEQEAHGEGIEAERRLAYVAFTRAQERLDIHYARSRPSRFLYESALIAAPAAEDREPARSKSPQAQNLVGRFLRSIIGSGRR